MHTYRCLSAANSQPEHSETDSCGLVVEHASTALNGDEALGAYRTETPLALGPSERCRPAADDEVTRRTTKKNEDRVCDDDENSDDDSRHLGCYFAVHSTPVFISR